MAQNDSSRPGSITEVDLQAYMDGQLDDARRIEVADYLARNPQAAAEVMASLRAMEALRLHARHQSEPSGRLVEGANRLEKGLKRRARQRSLLRFSGVAAAIAAGWVVIGTLHPLGTTGTSEAATTLAFVDDALDAHRALSLRQRMASQIESATYNPAELRTETSLAMPTLPADWQVTDVQIYPWDEGCSIAVTAEADDLGSVVLFAAPLSRKAAKGMRTATIGGNAAAIWQHDGLAYALVGNASESRLQAAAEMLLASLAAEPDQAPAHLTPVAGAL